MSKRYLLKAVALGAALSLTYCGTEDSVNSAKDETLGDLPTTEISSASEELLPVDLSSSDMSQDTGLAVSSSSIDSSSGEAAFSSSTDLAPASSASLSSSSGDVPVGAVAVSSSAVSSSSVAPSSSSIATSSSSVAPSSSSVAITAFLAGDNYYADGPLATTREESTGPAKLGWLVSPKDLTSDPNKKHPVVIFGPGGGGKPSDIVMILTRLASQGFVVYSEPSTWEGNEMFAAIDWLEKLNNDPNSRYYKKLMLDKIGTAGHSLGGISAEKTAVQDPRVFTAILCNSGAFGHDGMTTTSKPIGIIYGLEGMEKDNAVGDYKNALNKNPRWLGGMVGGGHGSGPWDGAGAVIAWMRWLIGGETHIRDMFIGSNPSNFNYAKGWVIESAGWENFKQ
ncbi:MAG: hypothetical protein HUK21_09410 [Fibrobacteraceae bacterium]|nr:hypothetical protein [Fibrobacteraceae bacterium]